MPWPNSTRSAGPALVLGALLLAPAGGAGQSPPPAAGAWPHAGQLAEHLTSEADPTQQYALYLPSGYRADREWPLLILLDPRGRALLPLERVREAADRLGYLVMSSYNSASDTYRDQNAAAINAMIADAQHRLAVDTRRLYLVGQSGTARAGWIYGYALRGHVAGLIGFGAALPEGFLITPRAENDPPPLVFFGAAGTTDFNFDEMWSMDTLLDRVRLPHRVTYFDGPHAWPPAETLAEGVAWVELMAMKYGLKPRDQAWIDRELAGQLALVDSLERAGDAYHAWRRCRGVVADFAGLADITTSAARLARLERDPAMTRVRDHLAENVARQLAYNDRLARFLGDFRKSDPPPLARIVSRVQLDELSRRAADPRDTITAQAAARGLGNLWAYASFYEPGDYLREGQPARALALLQLAERMQPGDGDVCYKQARALARLGRDGEAVNALECAARAGVDPARIAHEPDLSGLTGEPDYQALLARLRQGAPPGQAGASGG